MPACHGCGPAQDPRYPGNTEAGRHCPDKKSLSRLNRERLFCFGTLLRAVTHHVRRLPNPNARAVPSSFQALALYGVT